MGPLAQLTARFAALCFKRSKQYLLDLEMLHLNFQVDQIKKYESLKMGSVA